jgi:N-acetylglucosamine kinase-like BadF-type ATPase
VGEVRAREALIQAISDACAAAGIAPAEVRRACIGIAGVGRREIAETVSKIMAEALAGEVAIVGDMEIALEAAFGTRPGVIVIAGTGSIAYGRDFQGRTARAGGWGFAISDEGSAHWIGRTAVSDLLRAIDLEDKHQGAAEALPLFRALLAAWKLNSLDELVRVANSCPDFAALFPAIATTAHTGDLLSQHVLDQAGRELAQLAILVANRIFKNNGVDSLTVPLAMTGGVFRHSRRVREVFWNQVHTLDPRVNVNPQLVDPVAGALEMARRTGEKT